MTALPPFDEVLRLLEAGEKDAALLWYVQETDYVHPSDPELEPMNPGPACAFWLNRGLYWGNCPRPLAEQILRLLKDGELILSVGHFHADDPAVLTGATATLLAPDAAPPSDSPVALRQPAAGYRNPHRFMGALCVGCTWGRNA
jgi:hypothetical protein